MSRTLLILAATLLFATFSFGQSRHTVEGTIRNDAGEVVPALSIIARSDGEETKGITDGNGHYRLYLPPGNYLITAPELGEESFREYVSVTKESASTSRLDIVASTRPLCDPGTYKFLAVQKSVRPPYPPAARAVRAIGNVTVMVNVSEDGMVASAKAMDGHPLLRATAVKAAELFEFDRSGVTEKGEIEFPIRFVFTETNEEQNVLRFSCDYRIVIDASPIEVYQSTST